MTELIWSEFQLLCERTPGLVFDEFLQRRPELLNLIAVGDTDRSRNDLLPTSARSLTEASNQPQVLDGESSESIRTTRTVPEVPGYAIGELLGQGGMGVVYRARDLKLNREVAIKFALSGSFATANQQARFLREAKSLAALHHPQIIQIYDFGCHAGQMYLVFEYAAGASLSRKLTQQLPSPEEAASMLKELAGAIAYAHSRQIIHRDLKPSNILLDEFGTPKIADFGLAKQLSSSKSLTQDECVLATPSYSAPELIFGLAGSDPRAADIYSLGAILYELLTGRPPYMGSSAFEIVDQVRRTDIVRPRRLNRRIPLDLESICLKCLERRPEDRYQTALELADDLDRFLNKRPVSARPISKLTACWRWANRNRTAASLAAICMLSLLVTSVVATYSAVSLSRLRSRESAAHQRERIAWAEAQRVQQRNHSLESVTELMVESWKPVIKVDSHASPVEPVVLSLDTRRSILRSQYILLKSSQKQDANLFTALADLSEQMLICGAYLDAADIASEAEDLFFSTPDHSSQDPQEVTKCFLALARAQIEMGDLEGAQQRLNLAESLLPNIAEDRSLVEAELVIAKARIAMAVRDKLSLQKLHPAMQLAVSTIAHAEGKNSPSSITAQLTEIHVAYVLNQNRMDRLKELVSLYDQVQSTTGDGFMQLLIANAIAVIYQRMEEFELAEQWIDRALKLSQLVFGNDSHPVRSDLYADAAWIKHSRGNQISALDFYRKAYRSREKTTGLTAKTRSQRTEYFVRLLRHGEQVELRDASLEPTISSVPRDWLDAWMLRTTFTNAILHGDIDLAEKHADEFTQLLQHPHSSHDKECRDLLMAELACIRGDFSQAASLAYPWIEDACQHSDSTNRFVRITQWKAIGEQLGWLGRQDSLNVAATNLVDCIPETFEDFHVDNWLERSFMIDRLGRDLKGLNKLELWRNNKPDKVHALHPCEGMLQCALGRQLQRIDKVPEAILATSQGLQVLESSLGLSHPFTLEALLLLAELNLQNQDAEQSGQLSDDLLKRVQQANGKSSPILAHWQSRVIIAGLMRATEQFKTQCCLQAVEATRDTLGAYHPFTLE